MKVLIIYDSIYGNTQKIAQSIASAISNDVKVLRPGETNLSDLELIDLLFVGSPTNGGKPTPAIQDLLGRIQQSTIKDKDIAAFDTRFSSKWVGIFGYAAGKIAESLKKKGGNLILPPQAFFVKATKGPLKEGELERAASWAKTVIEAHAARTKPQAL